MKSWIASVACSLVLYTTILFIGSAMAGSSEPSFGFSSRSQAAIERFPSEDPNERLRARLQVRTMMDAIRKENAGRDVEWVYFRHISVPPRPSRLAWMVKYRVSTGGDASKVWRRSFIFDVFRDESGQRTVSVLRVAQSRRLPARDY